MRSLFVRDDKNYTQDMIEIERYCVRGVIIKDGKIAVQKGRIGDYKILGGGMEPNEDIAVALAREVEEESGLVIKKDSIREIGEILEIRRDIFEDDKKYVCHSWFYFCDVENELRETHMTASEIEKGYHFYWASFDEMIKGNEPFMHQPWIYRDTEFVKMLKDGRIKDV